MFFRLRLQALDCWQFFQRQIVKRIFRRLVDDDVALLRLPIIQQLCLNFSCSCVIIRDVSIYDILIVKVCPMSLEEIRENNIRLVTNNALNCFIKKGINKTTLSEIAAVSGLTERSIYRYYSSKEDLIIASTFCYWERVKAHIYKELEQNAFDTLTGIEQISIILKSYSDMLFVDPEGIRFSLDAEVALYQVGKNSHVINRPPERFERYTGPLSIAIRKGLADGTVSPNANIKQLYYNAYDSILGMMQRLTVGVPSANELDAQSRLSAMCDMFTREFAAKQPKI